MTTMTQLRQLVAGLQWCSTRQAAQPRHGFNIAPFPGPIYVACPLCGGVKPSNDATYYFAEKDIGHNAGCPIPRALEEDGNPTINAELLNALKGVVRVADRATVEFDAARATITKAEQEAT